MIFIVAVHNLQIKYYAIGKHILLCDMPGFERGDQESIRLEHVVKILEGKVQDKADVRICNYGPKSFDNVEKLWLE